MNKKKNEGYNKMNKKTRNEGYKKKNEEYNKINKKEKNDGL